MNEVINETTCRLRDPHKRTNPRPVPSEARRRTDAEREVSTPERRPPARRAARRMRAAHGASSEGFPRMRESPDADQGGGKRAAGRQWRCPVLRQVVVTGFRLWRSG